MYHGVFLSSSIAVAKKENYLALMPCPSMGPKLFWTVQIVLDCPNCFGRVQIVLVRSKSFRSGPNHFGQVHFSGLIFIIWTWPK
jgi:hypothetical protein